MIKAVIFDFNGTLFFDNDKHVQAWNEMSILLRQKGITEEELHTKLNGVPNHQIIEYFLGKEISQQESKSYSLQKEALYRKACVDDVASFHLVKGAEEYFNLLKKHHIPFTIASASIKENIDFFVKSFHLDQWFNVANIIYDNGRYKDKKQMFIDASKVLNCNIEDTLIFEDSLAGVTHAYESGCRNIIVICPKEKEATFKDLPGVIEVIEDFSTLTIHPNLKDYIEHIIIPTYKHYDKGHDEQHVLKVIKNSMEIAKDYDVDKEMVYAIAAFHDLGMPFGRKDHHLSSAVLAYYDHVLNECFDETQLTIIKEAIEDHRASSQNIPRSIYGKIIAEADRDIDVDTIIYRTWQYGLKRYPELDEEEHFQRLYEHLIEKYSETGYLKLHLETKKNSENLKKLRELIKDIDALKERYNKIVKS